MQKEYTGSVQKNTTQTIQTSKKSKTEEKDIMPKALAQSIRVLRTVPLISSIFLSTPSKLREFLSHQIHQKIQRGITSHRRLTLALQHPLPQQDKSSRTPHGITHVMSKMQKMKDQISLTVQQCNRREMRDRFTTFLTHATPIKHKNQVNL